MDKADSLSQYRQYVKENPADREGARKSYFDTFGVDPEAPRTAFQKQAIQRGADIGVQQTKAQYEGDIGQAKGEAAKTIGKGVVLGAATLGTGGLATGPAMAAMGVGGVGAEAAGETLKAGFGGYGTAESTKTAKTLAREMGLEGALSATGEGMARAIGWGLKALGKEVFPAIAMRSAAKAQKGQQALVRVQQDTFDQLRDFARTKGNPAVDIGDDIVDFFGTVRKRATGSSQAFKDATKPVFAKLWQAAEGAGGSLEKQPLDALMEIKSDINHIAFRSKGMNTDELIALRRLAEGVDKKIIGKLDEIGGPAAKKLYSNFKAFTEQISRDDVAAKLADGAIQSIIGKKGLLGLVPGVDPLVRSHAAPWVLEQMFSNPKTAEMVKKAVSLEAIGKSGAAQKAFEAAVNASGVASSLKDVFAQPAQEAPNAAPTR